MEMVGPREHHFRALRGPGAPVAEDTEKMPGKLLGARASSGAVGKIRHNRSKIENFIEFKSNRAVELSPTAGAQPAAHWDTKKGAGVSTGHRGYSTVGEWVFLTHRTAGRRQSHRHSSPLSLPSYLRIDPTGAKAETWCKLTSQTAQGKRVLQAPGSSHDLLGQFQAPVHTSEQPFPVRSQDLPPPCPARSRNPRLDQEQ